MRLVRLIVVVGAVLLLIGLGGAVAVAWPVLPFQQRWARERWQQRRPAHYLLQVRWNDVRGVRYLRAEIRDGRAIAITDLDTGAAIEPQQLGASLAMLDIDRLFDAIEDQSRPVANWRAQIARYHPLLSRWLDRCVERLPDVRYDAEYGYPTSIGFHSNPCLDALAFRSDTRVTIEQLEPLP